MRSDILIVKDTTRSMEYLLGVLMIGHDAQLCNVDDSAGTVEVTVAEREIIPIRNRHGVGYVRPIFSYNCSDPSLN